MSFVIRPFAAAEFSALVALMRETLALPALDEPLMARDFLLAPGFEPKHLLVAEAGGQVAGFVLAPRRDGLGTPEQGWIAGLGVSPQMRHSGIGTALLTTALAAMQAEGVTRVDVADVPVHYLLPGVDPIACPGATRLFEAKFGFRLREVVASMGIRLDRPFRKAEAVREVMLGELPLLHEFFAGWGPGWWEHIERSMQLKLIGDPTPAAALAWWEDGRPLGVCHYRGNRFGPLAVAEHARGRGIGAALTLAALADMRRAGYADAYFLIGREAVQPFYARLGFTILRGFRKLRLIF